MTEKPASTDDQRNDELTLPASRLGDAALPPALDAENDTPVDAPLPTSDREGVDEIAPVTAPEAEPDSDSEPLSTAPEPRADVAPSTPPAPVAAPVAARARTTLRDLFVAIGSGVVGGGLVLLLMFVGQFALRSTFEQMVPTLQTSVVVALLGGIAFFVAMSLGVWQRVLGFVAALVSGITVALVLLALWQPNRGIPVEGMNQLLFGLPGIVTGAGLSVLGGWVGMQMRRAFGAPAPLATFARVGVGAIAIWVVGELAARVASLLAFAPAQLATLLPYVIPIAIAYPILTAAIVAIGRRAGIRKSDWHYQWSGVNATIGAGVGLFLFAITFFLTARLDASLFGVIATAGTRAEAAFAAGPLWLQIAYLAVVGLLIPITEEWSWRGVIQTGLTRGMGQVTGFIITALAFVLKYILVSLSIVNLTTLLVIAVVLGLVRARAGTGASTITHIITNLLTATIVMYT